MDYQEQIKRVKEANVGLIRALEEGRDRELDIDRLSEATELVVVTATRVLQVVGESVTIPLKGMEEFDDEISEAEETDLDESSDS